jgi:amino acid permease
MGENTTFIVDTMIAVLCFAVCVIYARILGDVFTPLIAQSRFSAATRYNKRTYNIIALVVTCLLPMSLLKNLSSLAFTSVLGFGAIFYTVFFIVVRALDGSYTLGSGKFVTNRIQIALPQFQKSSWWNVDFTSLVLASNLGLAYIAHYNAPNFYRELRDTSPQRFSKMVSISFTILIILYMVTMAAGYSTFGDVCNANILLNYHPADALATLGRLATGFSILFGFPLVSSGCREAVLGAASSLNWIHAHESHHYHVPLVLGILTLTTVAACTVPDLSLVVGLTGATLGSFIVYVAPALLYQKAVQLKQGSHSREYKGAVMKSLLYIPLGLFVASVGVYMTVQQATGGSGGPPKLVFPMKPKVN